MSILRSDQFPNLKDAGFKKTLKQQQSSAICLQPTSNRDVQTPQEIQKYRKSYREQPGVTIRHYGVVNDKLPEQNHTYGVPTQKSEGSGNVMKAGSLSGVNKYLNEVNESKYKSLQRQPLGTSVNRSYNYPQQIKHNNDFKYGLQTEKNEFGAKDTIYSGINMPEEGQVRQMYLKSHGDYDAGQQKRREYAWNVDPTDFRFGKVQKNIVPKQMNQIMSPEGQDKFPTTTFVKSNLNDFIYKKQDKLGKPANLGQKQFPEDHIFGVRVQPNQWDAGKCLRGQATLYEVRIDDDLGKSKKPGFRNTVKEGDEYRVFGVPTIRYDIKKPERQSVADPNNYADETTAIELLFPKQFSSYGVGEDDFQKPRPKKEIKEIFENIGLGLRQNIFNAVFERAKAIEGTILEKVSCHAYKQALYEMSTPI